jgi:ABC-type sugar transport system substrate-binding protein
MGALNIVMNLALLLVAAALFGVLLYNSNSESVAEERNANIIDAFNKAFDNSKGIVDRRGGFDPQGAAQIVGEIWTASQSLSAIWLSGILMVLLFINALFCTTL